MTFLSLSLSLFVSKQTKNWALKTCKKTKCEKFVGGFLLHLLILSVIVVDSEKKLLQPKTSK